MPKSFGQKPKLLYLLKIFFEETDQDHPLTMKELIEKLNNLGVKAKRKSVYDDFEILQALGYDICSTRDKKTRYFMGNRDFEIPELELLLDAVQASNFIAYDKSITLINKIEKLSSHYQAEKLHKGIYIDDRTKTPNKKTYYAINTIHDCISDGNKIGFNYFKWDINKEKVYTHDRKTYCVSPHALVWNADKYYLLAYDSDEEKIKRFRVDKMDNAFCIDEPIDGREAFEAYNLATFTNTHFGMFGNDEPTKVTLNCKNSMSDIILDRFGHDVMLINNNDGTFNVTVTVYVSPPFISWLFTFGDDIKVIEPDNVIEEVKNTLKRISQIYK